MDKIESSEYNMFIKKIMEDQPVVNIGVIGHVANGKSTFTKALTGVITQKHSKELERNITIKLGYANAKIYKCGLCKAPEAYQSTGSHIYDHNCIHCGNPTELILHVSFTDCPGHNLLMSTMLNGTCIMDYTILLESCANTVIPAIQTIEHFQVTKEAGIETKIVCLNKTDLLVKEKEKIKDNIDKLRKFVGDKIPIVPVCCTLGLNTDVLCEYISRIPIPIKKIDEEIKMLVIRSFNINHPDTKISEIKGGVIGGSLTRGILKIGDKVKIYPGFIEKIGKKWKYSPLECEILSINSEKNKLEKAIPGGLIGVQLNIDPAHTVNDGLVGNVMFKDGCKEPNVFEKVQIKYKKISHRTDDHSTDDHDIVKGDNIQININSNNIKGKILNMDDDSIYLKLEKPICVELNDKVTINIINEDSGIVIYGSGIIIDGVSP
jgi:translation initiation factor 2 subunit 3